MTCPAPVGLSAWPGASMLGGAYAQIIEVLRVTQLAPGGRSAAVLSAVFSFAYICIAV